MSFAALRRLVQALPAHQREILRADLMASEVDAAARCPFADVPGEEPCANHTYSGCSRDSPGRRRP